MHHTHETPAMLDLLRQRVNYCPETGVLTWLQCGKELFLNDHGWAVWHGKFAGKPVSKRNAGYVVVSITIDGKAVYMPGHRVAWALHTGEWPSCQIDHENLCRSDNRWSNLRAASEHQNACNKPMDRRNKSGFKGVHQHSQNGNWIAQIGAHHKRHHIGVFATPEEAAAARAAAAQVLHGQFARN